MLAVGSDLIHPGPVRRPWRFGPLQFQPGPELIVCLALAFPCGTALADLGSAPGVCQLLLLELVG